MYSILSHAKSRVGLGHAAVVVAAGLLVGATSVLSQSPAQPGTPTTNARDVTSEAALLQQMQKSKRMSDFKGAFEPAPQVKPDLTPSLYKRSIILFDGEAHTVVPMGAVLHLPQNHRDHIIDEPKGALLMWPSFLKKNKDWVGGWEVSMAMAKGDPDLAKNVLKQTAQDTRVLVSVYKGNPITTLAPVPEQTSEAKK